MKKKIVIASVLKPVDDVRAYWKLSQSMAKTNKYEVNIIGNDGKKPPEDENIFFHSHSLERNQWVKRIILREEILFKILSLKPKILIITTHELINAALICKLLLGCKVIYDIQENYSRNMRYINSSALNYILSFLVYGKESLSRIFINEYWLAEECYSEELRFVRGKFRVIENKAIKYDHTVKSFSEYKLLFTGTISTYGGVQRAIEVFNNFKTSGIKVSLKIVGQFHDQSLANWLIAQAKSHTEIELTISSSPVPYEDILTSIEQSNLGIIGYEPSEVNRRKVPTKLYEYSRYKLPFLVQHNTSWSELGSQLGGAIPIEFSSFDVEKVCDILTEPSKLFPKSYPTEATWEYESNKIIESLDDLISST